VDPGIRGAAAGRSLDPVVRVTRGRIRARFQDGPTLREIPPEEWLGD
jgi:hypothetical protein